MPRNWLKVANNVRGLPSVAVVALLVACEGVASAPDTNAERPDPRPVSTDDSAALEANTLLALERDSWATARTFLVAYDDPTRSRPSHVVAASGGDLLGIANLDSDVAVLRYPTAYVSCGFGGSCTVLLRFDPGTHYYGARRAPGGQREVIVHGASERNVAIIVDLTTGTQQAQIDADGWLARGGLPLEWINDDRIFISWSAGTYVALARLYDSHGDMLLDLYCDAITSEAPFVACWSPPNAPVAGSHSGLQVYDLAADIDALRVPLPRELDDPDLDVHNVVFDRDGVWAFIGGRGSDAVRPVYVNLY